MRIQQLRLENFRGFEELVIDFPEKGSAVFIGVNGAGKSSVLEAVEVLLKHLLGDIAPTVFPLPPKPYLTKDDIRYYQKNNLSISSIINLKNMQFNYTKTFPYIAVEKNNSVQFDTIRQKFSYRKGYPFFTLFRSNRILVNNHNHEKYNGEFNKLTYFNDFINWFETRENFENQMKLELQDFNYIDKHLEIVRKSLLYFLNEIPSTQFSNLRMKRYDENTKKIEFTSEVKSFLSIEKNGQIFKINQLSDGEKIVIMMVADIARRFTFSNPRLNPINNQGIVLIDEIDLHLHPSWQRAIIPALEKTFPNIQFIVTTHSPQVLSTVKKENVFILEDFKLVEETPHTYGQDSNSILYNIFGINERPEHAAQDFKQLYRLIDDEKFQEAEKMLEEMSEKYGYYDSEIVRAKMHLEFNHH